MNNYFGIRVGIKAMPSSLQFGPQFRKVVNLAVEHQPHGPVFIEDGLMTACQVDNAEAAHAKPDPVFDEYTLIVRAAMNNGLAHPLNCYRVCLL
jgi:hypothetical protein